jgi:quercetin dioxygenase-like cupin family protein
MRRRPGLAIVLLVLATAACTISKSTPTERSSAGSVGAAASEAEETRVKNLAWAEVTATRGWAPGTKVARVHGDPSAEGDYTLRLSFPDGYVIPPHWHPKAEQVTVLNGNFVLGMGTTPQRSTAQTYQPGDFLYVPGKMAHYAWTQGETVIQVHGMGPFKTYTVGEDTRAETSGTPSDAAAPRD